MQIGLLEWGNPKIKNLNISMHEKATNFTYNQIIRKNGLRIKYC